MCLCAVKLGCSQLMSQQAWYVLMGLWVDDWKKQLTEAREKALSRTNAFCALKIIFLVLVLSFSLLLSDCLINCQKKLHAIT